MEGLKARLRFVESIAVFSNLLLLQFSAEPQRLPQRLQSNLPVLVLSHGRGLV